LPEEEDRLEDHLSGCAECSRELEVHRRMGGALDSLAIKAPAGLLNECRRDLMRTVDREAPMQMRARPGAWASFRDGFSALFAGFLRFRQPLGAVALLALGWFSARLTTTPATVSERLPSQEVVSANVRSVQPDASGRVQIALDETRRRMISGRLEDENIRQLLLAATREQDNPAVRVQSVGLLQAQAPEVKQALLRAALHDPSAAVRLKAVEGLRGIAADFDVRNTLSQVLLTDENPGVRIRTIDLLMEHRDNSMVGVLQDVVQKENNGYVRMQCERALKAMNASVGTF
jgi:hypothetical protein